MKVTSFLDHDTETYTHVLVDDNTKHCAIFDPVLGFCLHTGRTNTDMADKVIGFVKQKCLTLVYIIETHAHADHISSAAYIQDKLGGEIVIGEHIVSVQRVFKRVFNLGDDFKTDASQFNVLVKNGQRLVLGDLEIEAIHVPGHTPADVAYIVKDTLNTKNTPIDIAIFAGDTLFAYDVGTARCDFPGGDAGMLYESIQKLLCQPGHAKIYLCHDYPPKDAHGVRLRDYMAFTTVEKEKQHNKHVQKGVTKRDFIAMRMARDSRLNPPRYIIPSIQVNVNAGHLPKPENNGTSYMKVPLNIF